jgi:hypothetical protein
MHLVIHGHFYQPPRENPWTGKIPRQEDASPHHDWNERIASQCYAPNARSRILDERGRIEEIVNNYDWIHFDFGPTLLRWMEREDPEAYAEILQADERSRARNGGHGNAIAQAYNHPILPLAPLRDKRTQILWGLRDFEHRFGRRSEAIWLPETAIDSETLRVLVEFGMRYVILAPNQAKRVRPLGGGSWTDVSGGRIDPRRAYRVKLRRAAGKGGTIDAFFYDGPISAAISFDHLLRNASGLADRIQAIARGGGEDALIHAATDGEIYGHHEPFGDMCLAYLVTREGPLRGFRCTNYGHYLDLHPPQHEVELDLGEDGAGSSWSCAHGIDRWRRDCGCSTGGQPGWNQKWRATLRRGLEHLRERLLEIYLAGVPDLVRDPWEARDGYIEVLLDPTGGRERFIEKHAVGTLSPAQRQKLWRLLESQHQGMLMFTSCAWFFADLAGLEVQQNLAYAARAIELAQPYGRVDLEEELLAHLAEARSNRVNIGTGADVWTRFVRPMRRVPERIAIEAAGLLAAGDATAFDGSPAFGIDVISQTGSFAEDRFEVRLQVLDRSTEESFPFRVEATRDPEALMRLRVFRDGEIDRTAETGSMRTHGEGEAEPRPLLELTADELPPGIRARIVRILLGEILAREERRFDEIFESSRSLITRYHGRDMILPGVFQALASHVIDRRCGERAAELSQIPPGELDGTMIIAALEDTLDVAAGVGIQPDSGPVARVIEAALAANLANVQEVRTQNIRRSLDLILAAEKTGTKIRRTRLEEMVYALASHYRDALAARLAGQTVPQREIDPDVLIHLAEQSNVSLHSFEGTPARTA